MKSYWLDLTRFWLFYTEIKEATVKKVYVKEGDTVEEVIIVESYVVKRDRERNISHESTF